MGWKLAVVAAVVTVTGCASDDSAVCLSNDVGKVCADGGNGSIVFNGRGLIPGSDVLIANPDVGEATYRVSEDGMFEPGGRGILSFIAGTPFIFTVTAIDGDGQSLDGEITIAP